MGRKPFALKPPIIIKLLHNLSPQQHQCRGGCLGRFQCKGEERGWYHSSDREKGGTCKSPFRKVNDVLQGPNQGKLGNWRVPIRDWRCHRWQTHLDDHPSSIGHGCFVKLILRETGLHVNRVQGDTHEFQDLGKLKGFVMGNRDVQVLKQGNGPAPSAEVLRRGRMVLVGQKKSSRIWTMDDILR